MPEINQPSQPLEKADKTLRTWKRGDALSASKLNEPVIALNRLQGVGSPSQPSLFVRQRPPRIRFRLEGDAVLPDDGEDFSGNEVLWGENFEIAQFGLLGDGTFSVRLLIGGTLVGPTITQADIGTTLNAIAEAEIAQYRDDATINLRIISSSGVTKFALTFMTRFR